MKSLIRISAAVAFLSFFSGCVSSVTADRSSNVDLKSFDTYYVAKLPADERGVEKVIANSLSRYGVNATSGAAEAMPADTDVLVEYADRWMWDITMYMSGLKVVFRDPENNMIMASGNAARSSLTRDPMEEIVDEVIAAIFAQE